MSIDLLGKRVNSNTACNTETRCYDGDRRPSRYMSGGAQKSINRSALKQSLASASFAGSRPNRIGHWHLVTANVVRGRVAYKMRCCGYNLSRLRVALGIGLFAGMFPVLSYSSVLLTVRAGVCRNKNWIFPGGPLLRTPIKVLTEAPHIHSALITFLYVTRRL